MKIRGNNQGFIAFMTLVILIAAVILIISMMILSQINGSASRNYSYKIKSFCASDGVMTLITQDLIDYEEDKYVFSSLQDEDIGNTTVTGEYIHGSDDLDTVKGGGSSFGESTQTTDNFHFAYSPMVGDFQVSVRIRSLQNTDSYAKAALHARQNTDMNAAFFHTAITYGNGCYVHYRPSAGAAVEEPVNESGGAPIWFRLTRSGNTFIAEKSSDGSSWTTLLKQSVTMSDPVLVGLGVASHSSGNLCTAVFSDLTGLAGATASGTVVFEDNQIPVDYTITRTGSDLFMITTDAYFLSPKNQKLRHYSSRLTQNLRRNKGVQWDQMYYDSADIPVTLYDFRSDQSCPEFNIRGTIFYSGSNVTANYVANTLDSIHKPVLVKDNAFRTDFMNIFHPSWYTINKSARINATLNVDADKKVDCYIDHGYTFTWDFCDSLHTWFRPWGDSAGKSGTYRFDTLTGRWDGLKPWSSVSGAPASEGGWVTAHWDPTNPFANIVFYDTLRFRELPAPDTGIFQFGDSVDAWGVDSKYFVMGCGCDDGTHDFRSDEWRFMPLQNRGFKYDASRYIKPGDCSCCDKQNYGFTMEMHLKFVYKPGQVFHFRGDDDVWVFLDKRKVIDLGGIHLPCSMSVNLDTCGFTAGKEYSFDMFYCERNVESSNIYITTNLMFRRPQFPMRRNWKRDYGNLD